MRFTRLLLLLGVFLLALPAASTAVADQDDAGGQKQPLRSNTWS
jgi:hypothetical protein